ncbi:MAG: neutral/alkaline non-lysosomal ceramidase N-terminal domain-containing protein [Opitutaceae bacterium]|nr:neutral/alkaline non-lysosomal ceramidase N-terminal domain-containing protein [Opitutaceae bacterium]
MRSALRLARWLTFSIAACFLPATLPGAQAPATPWQVGVASRDITPEGSLWMAGYASRTAPSDRVDQKIRAKALALDDTRGGRVVIVTLDLIGVPAALRAHVERESAQRFGLKPHELLLNASHTHSAPLITLDRFELEHTFKRAATPEQIAVATRYEAGLRQALVDLVGESLQARAPGRLEFAQARAGFAMNRRRPEAKGQFSNNPNPGGPVDHDVPVLKVTGADGKVRALLFGYACHNTTLGESHISGDYAGHAQDFLQASYPGATALFLTGCGGDQNPYPRRKMVPDQKPEDLVRQHGRALANAVSTALNAPLRPVQGPLRGAYGHAMLDYQPLSKTELEAYLRPPHTPAVNARARDLLQKQARGKRSAPLACPVQVLRFGSDLTLVAIAGEVVVDYSLRLKRELKGPADVWVAGYSNDVFGYLASRRVLDEGGYEGGGANIRILNHPGPFTTDVEEKVIGKVHELLGQVRK